MLPPGGSMTLRLTERPTGTRRTGRRGDSDSETQINLKVKMGLDMYLTARRLASNEDYAEIQERTRQCGVFQSDVPQNEIERELAYWRKANAIHNWFVENVQNGVDNCEPSPVTRNQLQDLLNICKAVMNDKDNAANLLPTKAGFFFGSTDYDEDYFENVGETISHLDIILSDTTWCDGWTFYYEASW